MKQISLSLLAGLTLGLFYAQPCASAADAEGVALAIVYDTSGSMRDSVRDAKGDHRPKYLIANRALATLAEQIDAYAKNAGGSPRTVHAALYTFHNDSARAVIPFGPFNAEAFKNWAAGFNNPTGNTPLGNSLNVAANAVLNAPFSRKHVLVVTDGMNTAGPQPATTLARARQDASKKGAVVGVHFVAFDIAAKVFDPVKKLDATVVSAADEKQLNTQLDFILQKKILLEDEEPKK